MRYLRNLGRSTYVSSRFRAKIAETVQVTAFGAQSDGDDAARDGKRISMRRPARPAGGSNALGGRPE